MVLVIHRQNVFSQYANQVPRVVNTVKMNASSGPINQLKEAFFIIELWNFV